MPNEGCIAEVVKITGTLADIEQIEASISFNENLVGDISLPAAIGVIADTYEGPYTVMPSAHNDIVLETADKLMDDDVTVFRIPYYETSKTSGYTVYIASEV